MFQPCYQATIEHFEKKLVSAVLDTWTVHTMYIYSLHFFPLYNIYIVQCTGSLGPSLQDAGKAEDSAVVTKTMFSGNLASSRKCVECGQLNSKMAKKCLQCRSPLQVYIRHLLVFSVFSSLVNPWRACAGGLQ